MSAIQFLFATDLEEGEVLSQLQPRQHALQALLQGGRGRLAASPRHNNSSCRRRRHVILAHGGGGGGGHGGGGDRRH